MPSTLQLRLRQELESKSALEAAKVHAFDYIDQVMDRRVQPTAEEIAALGHFTEPLPENGLDGAAIVDELDRYGGPATIASLGGRYFGLVVGSALPAALGARWLADVWNQNTALYRLSPVGTHLESVCEDWLRDLFNLPHNTVAGFLSGSSVAILCGIAAGRERVFRNLGWDVNTKGLRGAPPIRVVAGRHTHATVVKAVAALGLGTDPIEWVDVDDQGRILTDKIPPLDSSTILLLQAGNVNSGSFDPFADICPRANAAGSWVHIDGAFGLWAAASAKLAHLMRGAELAQSWSADAHKTLNTPLDCGVLLCRDREALINALQASGAYIAYSEQRDGMLYTPEMSRRARAIELWASLKSLGRQGVETLVDQLHERATQMAAGLAAAGFEIVNDVVFNQVLVACGDDRLTQAILTDIQESGECWVGGSQWFGKPVIRVSISSWVTTEQDVERTVAAFSSARARILESAKT